MLAANGRALAVRIYKQSEYFLHKRQNSANPLPIGRIAAGQIWA